MKKLLIPAIIFASAFSLTACNKSPAEKTADAVRDQTTTAAKAVDSQADAMKATGAANADATKQAADNQASAMHTQADAMKDTGKKHADAIEDGKVAVAPKP